MGTNSAQVYLLLGDDALVDQCSVDHYRAQGPGGQKRNKTSSAVRLRHHPTGLMVTAVERRSQHVNKANAIDRLREAIALHVRGKVDVISYSRSSLLIEWVTEGGRLRIGTRNPSYYRVVAEVLDVLAACGVRVREAANCLGLSTAQLVHFLERDPKVWERVNQMRADAGEKPLR
jgi:hypothetical protein